MSFASVVSSRIDFITSEKEEELLDSFLSRFDHSKLNQAGIKVT